MNVSTGTEQNTKGYLHIYFPKVRATALPGFSSSYKSAGTQSVTFSAMDAKRADKASYTMIYEPLNEDGTVVAKSGSTVDWN